jgi:hypothetical protein
MKRASSFFEFQTPKHVKRQVTFNDTSTERVPQLSSSHSPTLKKSSQADHNLIVSPAYIKKPANNIISKIFTSDFWTPTMKLQYKKLSEGKLTQSPGGKSARSPVLCIPILEERFKRTYLDDLPKSDPRNVSKLDNLDKIIKECREARTKNLMLGKDLHSKSKILKKELMITKKSLRFQ